MYPFVDVNKNLELTNKHEPAFNSRKHPFSSFTAKKTVAVWCIVPFRVISGCHSGRGGPGFYNTKSLSVTEVFGMSRNVALVSKSWAKNVVVN